MSDTILPQLIRQIEEHQAAKQTVTRIATAPAIHHLLPDDYQGIPLKYEIRNIDRLIYNLPDVSLSPDEGILFRRTEHGIDTLTIFALVLNGKAE